MRKFYLRLVESGPDGFFSWIIFVGLWPLSCLYGLVVRLRLFAYELGYIKAYSASVPVVSVGNLAVGGTGKTPMADFLAKWAIHHNIPAAIVSRGYGGNYTADVVRVSTEGATKPEECGDEPFLLAMRNPAMSVFVARRRALGVKAAEEVGAKLIILDDGFQHRAVNRDLDIVLLDSRKPFGNGCTLPAGQLREPRAALQRSHLIIMTRSLPDTRQPPVMSKPVMHSQHVMSQKLTSLNGDVVSWEELAGKSCAAFAGIARPEEFFSGLQDHGLSLVDKMSLADHQEYDAELLDKLSRLAQTCDVLITTEKDAVKLAGQDFSVPCYQVGVELAFEDTSPLDKMLHELVLMKPSEQEKL